MNRNKPEGAAIIVMNPKTGEILAMASRPTYDLNHYGKGDKESYRNRAVVNVYEPGSTFKPLMAASALDSGKWSVSDVYHDTGSIQVADRTMHNWDEKGLGNVTLREIIMYSINTGMVHIAVKAGGPEPENNPTLRGVIATCKRENMPKDNIERAIKNAMGKIGRAHV